MLEAGAARHRHLVREVASQPLDRRRQPRRRREVETLRDHERRGVGERTARSHRRPQRAERDGAGRELEAERREEPREVEAVELQRQVQPSPGPQPRRPSPCRRTRRRSLGRARAPRCGAAGRAPSAARHPLPLAAAPSPRAGAARAARRRAASTRISTRRPSGSDEHAQVQASGRRHELGRRRPVPVPLRGVEPQLELPRQRDSRRADPDADVGPQARAAAEPRPRRASSTRTRASPRRSRTRPRQPQRRPRRDRHALDASRCPDSRGLGRHPGLDPPLETARQQPEDEDRREQQQRRAHEDQAKSSHPSPTVREPPGLPRRAARARPRVAFRATEPLA